MKSDPVIDRVRKIRHKISEKFQHDPNKIIKYYIDMQNIHPKKLIKLNKKKTNASV